jgi:hypothetical protein
LSGRFGAGTEITQVPYTINDGGSYYASRNLTGIGGITINTSASVTIDLGGFALIGGSGDGIAIDASIPLAHDITVRNGTVTGWSGAGIDLGERARGITIRSIAASNNSGHGIAADQGATVTNCTANDNGDLGIKVNEGSVNNCTVGHNGTTGIGAGNGSIIINCTAFFNATGIGVGEGASVVGCSSYDNTGNGFTIGPAGNIRGCAANRNDVGIVVTDGLAVGNVAGGNDSADISLLAGAVGFNNLDL